MITGFYCRSADNVHHGFVRAADGSITTFNALGAGRGGYQGTEAYSINDAGSIAGRFFDGRNVAHGFGRDADGANTRFDAPGAGTSANEGTFGSSHQHGAQQ